MSWRRVRLRCNDTRVDGSKVNSRWRRVHRWNGRITVVPRLYLRHHPVDGSTNILAGYKLRDPLRESRDGVVLYRFDIRNHVEARDQITAVKAAVEDMNWLILGGMSVMVVG